MVDTPDSATESQQTLRLLVKGFAGFDQRLLDGVVKLSKRRNPALELVDAVTAAGVDVVMVDGKDAQAVAWAHSQQTWLAGQAVVWVDAEHELPASHTGLKRPVQWTNLPVILSRAMDDAAHLAGHAAAGSAAAAAGANASSGAASAPASASDKQCLAAAAARLEAGAHSQQASAAHTVAAPAAEPVAHAPGISPKILVVDDSAAVRGHLESALKAVGYEVTAVDSGEAAIMAVGARPYACILMDVLMPGIDGYEACRKIKAMPLNGRGVRPAIVMLTSKSSPFDRIRGKMAGCDAYLTKPVQRSHLMQVLAEHCFKHLTAA
ncbi:MAG: response regulator [Brachymonas sp.]|nr:response regulator [Brachymonas sp.]